MADLAQLPRTTRGASLRGARRPSAPQRYMAFLSYSHDDAEMAEWLHESLEEFAVPPRLVGKLTDQGPVPKKLSPIFRDRQELAAAHDLSEEIEEAIASSRFLIVLCSPDAAKSRWIDEEIACFKRMHREDRILAAIIAGEPFASDMSGRDGEECFPPSLRVRFDSRGRPTAQRAEPVAADLRDEGDGKRMGLLKVAAGMLGVGLDELAQREAQRRHRRLYAITAASVAGMLFTSGLAYTAIDARDEARDQRREAEGLIEFMLGDLRQKLEPVGRLDVLDAVGVRALAYYESQNEQSLSDDALAQRSKALTLIGEIANQRGDLDGAQRRYREAFASTAELLRREPNNGQRLFDHAQNVFYVGQLAWQRGQTDQAERSMREYKRLADHMLALDPRNDKWRLERKYANTSLGAVLIDLRRYGEAAAIFQESLIEVERLAASDPQNSAYQESRLETLAWLSEAFEKDGRIADGLKQRERQIALLAPLIIQPNSEAQFRLQAMIAHRAAGRLQASTGNLAAGLDHLRRSVALGERLMRTEPDNAEWAGLAASPILDLGELQLASGQLEQASQSAHAGCDIADRLVARDSSVEKWRVGLRSECLVLRTRLALARGLHAEAVSSADQLVRLARAEFGQAATADVRQALSRAQLIRGMVASRAGDRNVAKAAYAAAFAAWPKGVTSPPLWQASHALILQAVGRNSEANAVARELEAMGYRHPTYLRERKTIREV